EVDRLLAIPSSPSLPLTTYSSPVPQLPSPPLPVSSPLPISPPPLPVSPTHPLGYRAAMIRLRAKSPSTSHPLSLPPLIILPRTRASMAMIRATEPSTYILAPRSKTPSSGTRPLLPIPLPISSPPLLLPSTDCRANGLKSMDASDTTCSEVRALRTTVLAQQTEIGELRVADRRRQTQLTEALTLLRTLQTQIAALQSQQTPARDLTHPEVPEEVDSSS
ncbi:hypothetical protein Tco_0037170, partial [Tanacetum coccineum]